MKHRGYNSNITSTNLGQKFKYNGVEFEESLGLNLYEMDFRQYDPSIGRFSSVDKLSELAPHMTPYRFAFNNPIYWSDPTGLIEESVLLDMFYRSSSGTTWYNDGYSGFYTNSGGYVAYTSDDSSMNTSPDYEYNLNTVNVTYKNEKSYQNAAFDVEWQIYGSYYYDDYSDEEMEKIMSGFFDRVGLTYGYAGLNNNYKSGKYRQTNGKIGNFHDRPYNKLSRNAKLNMNFSKALRKVGIVGNIIQVGTIGNDILQDGSIQTSNVVNGVLMAVALINPVTATIVLVYGVLDYTFDISEKIDKEFGQIKLYDKR